MRHFAFAVCSLWLLLPSAATQQELPPPPAPPARPAAPALPLVTIVGADTLVPMTAAWASAYSAAAPPTKVQASGSGTCIGKLTAGDAHAAATTRRITDEERAAVRAAGFEPMELHVASMALAVCVAADHPLRSLTLDQLTGIYDGSIARWSQLDVAVTGNDLIQPVHRKRPSVVRAHFTEFVLAKSNSRRGAVDVADPTSLADFLVRRPDAIGYSATADVDARLRAVALGKPGGPAVLPTAAAIADGSYPLVCPVYLYFRDEPTGTVRALVQWIHGPQGRVLTQNSGFVPTAR